MGKNEEVELPSVSKIEAIILEMLIENPTRYGLEMVEQSRGRLKRGTIYVTLSRMQEKGLIDSRYEPRPSPEVGIPRRLYSLTDFGERIWYAYEAGRQRFAELMPPVGVAQ